MWRKMKRCGLNSPLKNPSVENGHALRRYYERFFLGVLTFVVKPVKVASHIQRAGKWGLALIIWAGCVVTAAAGWKVTDRLPDLKGKGLEGRVPELAGQVVLVDFWASWCGPCKKSFPELEALYKEYGAKGLVVLGVNVDDSAEAMQEFLDKHPVTFPMVRDAQHKIAAQASIEGMPSSYVIDRKGVIRAVHSGFHGEETVKAYREEIERLLKE